MSMKLYRREIWSQVHVLRLFSVKNMQNDTNILPRKTQLSMCTKRPLVVGVMNPAPGVKTQRNLISWKKNLSEKRGHSVFLI